MAEPAYEEPNEVPKAPYPAPPPFWRQFTTQNLARLTDLETSSESPLNHHDLPFELAVLRPPPIPASAATSYKTFNELHHLPPKPTLPPTEEETLVDFESLTGATGSARPHARKLWQLTKSLNLNFLELLTVMGDNPVDWEDKLKDIGTLLQNIHGVINVLRPHQAREQVKIMLESRLDEGKDELERYDQMKIEVETFLSSVESEGRSSDGGGEHQMEHDVSRSNGLYGLDHDRTGAKAHEAKGAAIERARQTWAMLHALDSE